MHPFPLSREMWEASIRRLPLTLFFFTVPFLVLPRIGDQWSRLSFWLSIATKLG